MKLRSKKGFSLIELMVAIGILSFGMAGIGSMLYQSFQFDRSNSKQRRAHIVASQIAERFRSGNMPMLNRELGTVKKLSDNGDGVILGTELWWRDLDTGGSPVKTDGVYFCRWDTYPKPPATAEFKTRDIRVGWGTGECGRTKVDQCPHKLRVVLMEPKS
jgi:prepilin-type N-terminal cleavage/methylation domain-containing protein